MNKLYLSAAALVSLVVLATSSSMAIAKGTDDNPAVVIIDQSGSSNNVDANITNDENSPVPVVSVAQQPYQFLYTLSASPGTVSDCMSIPVPTGKVLTITTIGVQTEVDPTENPDVYLAVTRSFLPVARYRGVLNFIEENIRKRYQGIYNLLVPIGETDSGNPYLASICVAAPIGGTAIVSDAKGTVSGYVAATAIIDGNSLP